MEPDGYLQPRRYRESFCCDRCGHEWSRITTKPGGKEPPCPLKACKEAALEEEINLRAENMARILLEQRAPGVIGNNVQNKAIDTTAEIVMQDHHLTDLRDNIRPGESMAPKLPGPQQAAADNFFSAGAAAGSRQAKMMSRLGQRAIAGAFRSTALNPATIVGGTPGETPLRVVGQERLK